MTADSIRIETNEDGFWLVIDTVDAVGQPDSFDFRISDPEALYDHVKAAIGPWLKEAELARLPLSRFFACEPDESGGYAADDPKSEGFHDRMSSVWDERTGK